jgi:hypothetical protein
MDSISDTFGAICYTLFAIWIYLIPTSVAKFRDKKNIGGVFMINLFGGWSVIGWIAALVMACL